MPARTKKKFDAVTFMRKQRDRISLETAGMNLEQLKEYINKRLKKRQATGKARRNCGVRSNQ